MKHVLFSILTILLLLPLTSESQDQKTEVSIYSGISFLDADGKIPDCLICEIGVSPLPFFQGETTIDDSFLFGVKVGRYLNNNMQMEGNFSIAPNHEIQTQFNNFCPPGEICPLEGLLPDLFPSFISQSPAVAYHYNANFVYNFRFESLRPFFTIGVGGVSTDAEDEVKTDFAFNFGGGAKFYFKNMGLRFEVNDHIIPDYFLTGNTENNLQVLYGFLFRVD